MIWVAGLAIEIPRAVVTGVVSYRASGPFLGRTFADVMYRISLDWLEGLRGELGSYNYLMKG